MPSYPHIEEYRKHLDQLIQYGGSDNEQNIRRAFENCLVAYCADQREKLVLVPELRAPGGIIPDGTVKDSMRLSRGYWEAKDLHDNLDAEIQIKLNQGYPNDNILFENSRTAVLIQRNTEARRADMRDRAQLHYIIQSFLTYITREVEEFRQAWRQFKEDLPDILAALREAIRRAAEKGEFQAAAAAFLDLCRRTIGPEVSDDDVHEMLIQHILTKDIFLRVFAEDQYHQENNIARQLDALAQTFFNGTLRRDTTDDLLPYYGAITAAAANIADYREKQRFLKAVYEDFYQVYNPAAADRLGVVYTPNEVVDFIIRGADHLLQKHFGRTLADKNVQILDPATGTGTFVTSLIDYLPEDRLEYKYLKEIHANEVAILPYYIANLNIEYSYKEKTGHYLEFPNLCFVDTLDNMDWKGASTGVVERQPALGALSEENWIRVQEQNEKPISVIIGNPPYNANQQNENDNNKNREYPDIDERISNTYIADSTAQKTKQYDMYKRFIRWASDRLDDDGIIGFVSNNAFLDARQDDGFRSVVAEEFSELWVIDLKGNARTSGERRRQEAANVFENKIRVGVAIYFLVRRQGARDFRMFYSAVNDYAKVADKVNFIKNKSLPSFEFTEIIPDSESNWLNQPTSDFGRLVPLATKETKFAKFVSDQRAVFKRYSLGVITARDEWVYDFDTVQLGKKVKAFIREYEGRRAVYGGKKFEAAELGTSIKWTRDLKRQLRSNSPNSYNHRSIRQTLFRPFIEKHLYFRKNLNEMQYQLPEIFPTGDIQENKVICFSGLASNKPFSVLATDKVFGHDTLEKTQCLPLYRYTKKGKQVSNVTRWGLRKFREHYGTDAISAEELFAYTYAVLHDPVYREKYAVDLLRGFPRLPFYRDFKDWVKMGHELLELHIGFETVEPYQLKQVERSARKNRVILRANKEGGNIILDDRTMLTGVPTDAWRYTLGNRSALEWVLDQYKEKKPRDPTIAELFDTYRFADHKEKVIDLVRRVCTVSVKTMDVVDDMAYWDDEGRLIVLGDRDNDELAMVGLAGQAGQNESGEEDEDEDWLAAWSDR